MKFRKFVKLAGAVLLILNSASRAADPAVLVSVHLAQETMKFGDRPMLQITIRNVSGQNLPICCSNNPFHGEGNFEVQLTDPQGQVLKVYNLSLTKIITGLASSGSSSAEYIYDGDEYRETILLDDIFEINKTGKYKIHLNPRFSVPVETKWVGRDLEFEITGQ